MGGEQKDRPKAALKDARDGRQAELCRLDRAPPLLHFAERRQPEPAETDEHQRPGGGLGNGRAWDQGIDNATVKLDRALYRR